MLGTNHLITRLAVLTLEDLAMGQAGRSRGCAYLTKDVLRALMT